MKILKYPNFKNTNLANWLILASLVAFLMQSCTTPQSVGYNMKTKNPPKVKTTHSEEKKKDDLQSQVEVIIPEQNNYSDRLPTLREQMKLIADKQIEIEVDVDIIKSEISLIKAELVDLKSSLMTDGKIIQKQIVTGETNSKPNKISKKQIEEETFLLPDEAVQNVPPKKIVKDKPIIVKPPKKSDSKQSSNINSDEVHYEKTSENNQLKVVENNNDKPTINNNLSIKDNEAYEKVKLAESLANSGKLDEARKIYQEILKQNPKNELTPIAKKMLQQL